MSNLRIPYPDFEMDYPDRAFTAIRIRNKNIKKLNVKSVTDLVLIDCYIEAGAINIGSATTVTLVTNDLLLQSKRIKINELAASDVNWFSTFKEYRDSLPDYMKPIPFEELIWPPIHSIKPVLTSMQRKENKVEKSNKKWKRLNVVLLWLNIFCILFNIMVGNVWIIWINIIAIISIYYANKNLGGKFRFGNIIKLISSIKIVSDEDTIEEPELEEVNNEDEDILEYEA